jgi:hypothetical protein
MAWILIRQQSGVIADKIITTKKGYQPDGSKSGQALTLMA